jgi:hypothetical protein
MTSRMKFDDDCSVLLVEYDTQSRGDFLRWVQASFEVARLPLGSTVALGTSMSCGSLTLTSSARPCYASSVWRPVVNARSLYARGPCGCRACVRILSGFAASACCTNA